MRQQINQAPPRLQIDPIAILEDNGHRPTSQRCTLARLLQTRHEGFSAEEVCKALPEIGRATIYRTIKLFLTAGVLCRLVLPDGAPKYALARPDHHHHTVCVKCGTVSEFRDGTVERVLRAVGSEIPGEIVSHRMELYLVCQACLDKTKD